MQIKKRIQNRSIRLYKAAMMIKDYNISKVKYKWSILMITWIKIKLSIIKSGYIFQIIHPYRKLIIGGSGSGKTNALLNLINNQLDIDKIYLYAKDPYETKYHVLIDKRESTGLKHFNDPIAFIEYSNNMHDVYKNIDEYCTDKERKILIVFDDMIDMINNKKLNSVVTEMFIRGRKLNIVSLVFITQAYFKVLKDVRLNSTHFFIMKILHKKELQQIELNHSSDISAKDFIKIHKTCTAESYSFLINDTTLASDNPLRFRKNLFNIQ